MSDPMAALSRAQDLLRDVLDEARSIAGNPSAGAKPKAVAEAVLEASPLVDEALDGWPEEPDEGPPDIGPPDEHPGGETYSVANDAELASAMDRARPGDVVELAPGDYATAALTGEAAAFRAAPPLGAVFTRTVTVAGVDVIVDGLAFLDGLRLQGRDSLATGCTVGARSDDVMACLDLSGDGAEAEWCDVAGFAHRGVLLTGTGSECRDSRVHGQRPGASGNTDAVAAVMFGGWHADEPSAQEMLGARLARCLVDDLEWRCAIELKASGCVVEGCTAIGREDGRAADCYVRHSVGNEFRSCFVERGGIQIGDHNNEIHSCETTNGCAFKKGGVDGDDLREGATGYPYSVSGVITNAKGPVITDWANGSGSDWAHMPVDSKVAGVSEAQIQGKGPYEVDASVLPDPPAPPARKLQPSEVGPQARPNRTS